MVAPRSQEFVEYVDARDSSLSSLIGLGSLETPGGSVDFGHLLASMDLVSRGLPITGSWAATAWSWPGSIWVRPPTPRAM